MDKRTTADSDHDPSQDREHDKVGRPDRRDAIDTHSRQGQKGDHGQRPASRPDRQRKLEKGEPVDETATHDFGGTGGVEA